MSTPSRWEALSPDAVLTVLSLLVFASCPVSSEPRRLYFHGCPFAQSFYFLLLSSSVWSSLLIALSSQARPPVPVSSSKWETHTGLSQGSQGCCLWRLFPREQRWTSKQETFCRDPDIPLKEEKKACVKANPDCRWGMGLSLFLSLPVCPTVRGKELRDHFSLIYNFLGGWLTSAST